MKRPPTTKLNSPYIWYINVVFLLKNIQIKDVEMNKQKVLCSMDEMSRCNISSVFGHEAFGTLKGVRWSGARDYSRLASYRRRFPRLLAALGSSDCVVCQHGFRSVSKVSSANEKHLLFHGLNRFCHITDSTVLTDMAALPELYFASLLLFKQKLPLFSMSFIL